MDIRYFALTEWVERDLISLERIDTTMIMADHFTKQLAPTLFARHVDHILGHVPPPYAPSYRLRTGNVPTIQYHTSSVNTVSTCSTDTKTTGVTFTSLYSQWLPIVWHRIVSSSCTLS